MSWRPSLLTANYPPDGCPRQLRPLNGVRLSLVFRGTNETTGKAPPRFPCAWRRARAASGGNGRAQPRFQPTDADEFAGRPAMASLDAGHSNARLERLMRPHAHPEEW